MNPIRHTAVVIALATAATLTSFGADTIAHADPSPTPPSPDYVCDDLFTFALPRPATVQAFNCEARHGAPYGNFTNKIIAERHDPQAHIFCWSGLVSERGYFIASDANCHLVWYKKPGSAVNSHEN
jgi:hypothetical protein